MGWGGTHRLRSAARAVSAAPGGRRLHGAVWLVANELLHPGVMRRLAAGVVAAGLGRPDMTGGQVGDSLYENTWLYQMFFATRRHDLEFYEQATAACERVLDYGIGAGRVALVLARAGRVVVGIDNSESMLALLAQRVEQLPPKVRERLTWRLGDARQVQLGQQFDAVICPFNGLAHHHDQVQLTAFFRRVREHMRDDGYFVFDVLLPDPALLAGSSHTAQRRADQRATQR